MMFNQSRGCVKTVSSKFGNDQFFDMRSFVAMSRRIKWSKNEFSHSLSPEPTAGGAGCHRATGSADTVHVASRRCLTSQRILKNNPESCLFQRVAGYCGGC